MRPWENGKRKMELNFCRLMQVLQKMITSPWKEADVSDNSKLIKQAAKILQKELLDAPDVNSSWPPTEEQVLSAKYITPPLTKKFLSHFTSRGKKSQRSLRLISSIAQDLAYNASSRTKRT